MRWWWRSRRWSPGSAAGEGARGSHVTWNPFGFLRERRRRREQVARDALAFIETHGASAYEAARTRARDIRRGRIIDPERPAGHRDRVRAKIGRLTKRQHVDTATRWLEP